MLAAGVPSRENGQVAPDGLSVVWHLKRGVHWHDGRPFTADDVVFTWEYSIDGGGVGGRYRDLERVEKLNDHAIRVVFREPTAFWADAFCGTDTGQILPRHVFGPFRGRAREAPANHHPVGTGPYRCVEFRPADVLRAERNPHYHVAGRPFFDTLELKGGGDAVSAARAVLQTGDCDYAWNLQVEDEVLSRLERSGRGRVVVTPTAHVEQILLNLTDPWREIEGERSSLKAPHPILADPLVRRALGLLVDRATIASELYGRFGRKEVSFPLPAARPWLRTSEAAARLYVQPRTVTRWAHEGRLQHRRTLGGHRRYDPDLIDALVQALTHRP